MCACVRVGGSGGRDVVAVSGADAYSESNEQSDSPSLSLVTPTTTTKNNKIKWKTFDQSIRIGWLLLESDPKNHELN